jgi:hypothetical protein
VGEGESVEIKGRSGMETVFPVIARKPSRTAALEGTDDFTKRANGDLEGNFDPSP